MSVASYLLSSSHLLTFLSLSLQQMPEGAMKKDGPSAGVAMTMSILSLFSGQPLDPRLA